MNFAGLEESLTKLGIEKGDILCVASDLSLLLYEEAEKKQIVNKAECGVFLDQLIDMLKKMVGEKGTLLFPTFTWKFCEGELFNYASTPSECGVLSNWALQRQDFVRTTHPIYSFAVWGMHAQELKALQNTDSWGLDSPFAFLHHQKAKQLFINVTLKNSFTFTHYVEQVNQVKYRYMKKFTSLYINEIGEKSEREYSMYVRDLVTNPITYLPENFLDENNAAKSMQFGNLRFKLVDLDKAYQVMTKDIQENGAKNLVQIKNSSSGA